MPSTLDSVIVSNASQIISLMKGNVYLMEKGSGVGVTVQELYLMTSSEFPSFGDGMIIIV